MPKCKNDPTRKYKGTEPSPKGLGYCAHSMKIGAVKKGKDGGKWEVREVKNGSKRWMKVKELDIDKVKKIKSVKKKLKTSDKKVKISNKEYFIINNEDKKSLMDGIKNYFKKENKKDLLKVNDNIEFILYFKKNVLYDDNDNNSAYLDVFDCKNLAVYRKEVKTLFGGISVETIFGIKNGDFIHKYVDYNKFEKIKTKIPCDYKRGKISNKKNDYCGVSRKNKKIYDDKLIIKYLKSLKLLKYLNNVIYIDDKTYQLKEYNLPFSIKLNKNDIKSVKKINDTFEIKLNIKLHKNKSYIKNISKKDLFLKDLIKVLFENINYSINGSGIWDNLTETEKNKYFYFNLLLNKCKAKILL